MVAKIGITGIRPNDFYGHCPQCHQDCMDNLEKIVFGKFCWFEVEDKCKNYAPNTSPHEKYLTKDYPNGSASGGDCEDAFLSVPVARCTNLGDIRIGYSDSYVELLKDDDTKVTYMKKPERYYAEEVIPKPLMANFPNGGYDEALADWNVKILTWIKCRHKHTDHVDIITQGNDEVRTTIDDCVAGIWDGPEIWNVVDTFTTIEEIDVYTKMDYFSVYPTCGGGGVSTSAKDDSIPSFTVDEEDDVHDFEFKEEVMGFPGEFETMKGKAFTIKVNHGGTGCRDTGSRRSLHPHMVGVNAGNGTDYNPTGSNGPDPRASRGRYFKMGLGNSVLGLYRQTYAKKLGTIYKTTITAPLNPMHFQHPTAGEYWTILHPNAPGKKTRDNKRSLWYDDTGGCEASYGSPHLLEFPCEDSLREASPVDICDKHLDVFCQSQEDNIYGSLQEAADELNKKKTRRKLVRGNAPIIPRKNCSSLITFSKVTEGHVTSIATNPSTKCWEEAEAIGRKDKSEEGRSNPLELNWTNSLSEFKIYMPEYPSPDSRANERDGIPNEDWYDLKGTHYKQYSFDDPYRGKRHCGDGADDCLISVSFYQADLGRWGDASGSAPFSTSWLIPFEKHLIRKIDFEFARETVPAGYGVGGFHTTVEDSMKAWTCIKRNVSDNDGTSSRGFREAPDLVSAGVFYRYSLDEYKYDIEKKVGVSDLPVWGLWDDPCDDADDLFNRNFKPAKPAECEPQDPRDKLIGSGYGDGQCNLKDLNPAPCNEPPTGNKVISMNIFTGDGSPPPRYDVGQRVGNRVKAEPCTIIYDDISMLAGRTRDNILDCYKDEDGKIKPETPDSIKCPVLDDKGDPELDPETQEPIFELCLQHEKYIYAVHRRYFKVKIPDAFYSCGEYIADDDDGLICDKKWPCVTCCGLVPSDMGQSHVGCAKCKNFEKVILANGVCATECKDSFCCGKEVPNPWCHDADGKLDLNMPGCCNPRDGDGNCMYMALNFIPGVDGSSCWDPFVCTIKGYLPGEKHSPYEKGFLWQTYYGWRPETSLGDYYASNRFSCYDEDLANTCVAGVWQLIDCCLPKIRVLDKDGKPVVDKDGKPVFENDPDYIPCVLVAVPRAPEAKPLPIDIGGIPVKITLRSPECEMEQWDKLEPENNMGYGGNDTPRLP